jgi:hypothetical protein
VLSGFSVGRWSKGRRPIFLGVYSILTVSLFERVARSIRPLSFRSSFDHERDFTLRRMKLNLLQQLAQRPAVKFFKPLREFASQHGAAIAEYGMKGRQELSDTVGALEEDQ